METPAHISAIMLEFINERPDFITALKNSGGNEADYHRWQGHAEARRHLAERLSMTTPHEPGETAQHVRLVDPVAKP